MSIRDYVRRFAKKFPVGSELTKGEFAKFLEDEELLDPITDYDDRNQLIGYEQNMHKLRNEMNAVSIKYKGGFRIDILERNKSLVVRSLLEALQHDKEYYITKLITQTENRIENANEIMRYVDTTSLTNKQKSDFFSDYNILMHDLKTLIERIKFMASERKKDS
jgi:sulfite reductase alpha subunit-like flavoprotein